MTEWVTFFSLSGLHVQFMSCWRKVHTRAIQRYPPCIAVTSPSMSYPFREAPNVFMHGQDEGETYSPSFLIYAPPCLYAKTNAPEQRLAEPKPPSRNPSLASVANGHATLDGPRTAAQGSSPQGFRTELAHRGTTACSDGTPGRPII